jgi:hypothetical protein
MRDMLKTSIRAAVFLFALCLGASSWAAAAPGGTVAGDKLPPAQEIIARFVKEIGGEDAFAKIESQHIHGKFDLGAQGITGALEVFAKRPDKLLIKISLQGMGEMLQGYDGKVSWSHDPHDWPDGSRGEGTRAITRASAFRRGAARRL